MAYNSIEFFALFLPVVILLYQLCKDKYRWIVLLIASYTFFFMFSKFLLLYNIGTVLITYAIAHYINRLNISKPKDKDEKKHFASKKKKILALGIIINLLVLAFLKYTNAFGDVLSSFSKMFGEGFSFKHLEILVPIGVSYYTFQAISYLIDIYRKTIEPESNIAKLALYLSFFPTLVEGPITRFSDISNEIFSGNPITYNNLAKGYQRILYGLFLKLVIADHMAFGVDRLFDPTRSYSGAAYLFGAVLCTLQLYYDFAGTVDICLGSAKVFGVKLPENFRQPFFAKNAGDFWHRWHITLGTWFKDYIFYPISFAKPMGKLSKKVKNVFGIGVSKLFTPTIALFAVWISNGLWHGPKITYIFYGLYYFVLIFIENCLEKPIGKFNEKHNINDNNKLLKAFRFIKLCIIVVVGETIFRADSVADGFRMLGKIFTDFDFSAFIHSLSDLVHEPYDLIIMFVGFIIVLIVDIMRERGKCFTSYLETKPKAVRWIFWYIAIFIVILFGAYGPGYDAVAMMYAAF